MSLKHFKLPFAWLSLVLPIQLYGDTILTWQQCVQKVTENNPDLAASYSNVKSSQAQYSGSYSNFFPQISGSVGYTNSSSQGSIPAAGSLTQTVASKDQYTESLTLNQSLFSGFKDVGKVKQAEANLRAAKEQLAIQKSTLSVSLKTAYAQLLFQQKSVDLTESIWQRQMQNLRMISLRYQGGSENKGSLLYQKGVVSQSKFQHERSIRQLRNAAKQLASLWGEPNLRNVRVAGDLEWRAPATESNFEDIAAKNPTHLNSIHLQKAADAAVEVADSGWYPNLNLIGTIGRVGSDWPPQSERWSAGVALTVPLFPGTSQIFSAEAARAQKMQAEFQEHSVDFKLIAGLENAYDALLDAISQVEVARDFEVAAQARSRIANGRYRSGLMAFEDWSVIDADLVNREQTLLQAELAAMQAQANWDNAQGTGDIQ